ncbi:Transcriptional regulator, partial [Pseudomonas cannabina]
MTPSKQKITNRHVGAEVGSEDFMQWELSQGLPENYDSVIQQDKRFFSVHCAALSSSVHQTGSLIMRILVVEDEPKTAEYMHQGLTESGYVVDIAATGLDGLYLAQHQAYDVVILDVN